jgi:glycine cleavage system H protein
MDMNIPENIKYTKDHEWLTLDGTTGTIGITDYAQGELGDVVFVELPAIGKAIVKGQTFGTIEAVKAVSDLYAPVSGEVIEVNKSLDQTPELVNKEPYDGGWMIKVRLSDIGEANELLSAKAYRELIGL